MAENTKDLLTFKKGLRENLPGLDQCKAGTIYVTTDERAMYVDISDTQRIRLGDFIEYATEDDFKKAGHYSETALYYIAEGHKLLKYSKTNDDNTIDFVYLNSTSTIATDLAELTKQVNTNKTDIATLKTDRVTVTDFNTFKEANTAAIAAAKKAGDDAQADVDALEGVVNHATTGLAATKDIADKNKTGIAALDTRVSNLETDKADADDVASEVTRLEGLISTAQTQANKGVTDAAAAQGTANSALAQANTNKTDISNLKTNKLNVADFNTFKTENSEVIAAAKKAGDDAQKDVDDLEAVVNHATTGLAATKAIADKNKSDIANLGSTKADKTAVASEVERLEGLISTAKDQADKGVADAATAQTKANSAYDLADGANTQANTNKTNITNLTTRVKDLEDNSATSAELNSAVETLNEAIEAAAAKGQTGINDAAAAQGTADSALAQANTNKTDISNLKTNKVNVSDFNTFKTSNSEAIAAAKKSGDDAQADVDALELVVNNSTTGLAATKAIADKNKTDLAALTTRVKANEDNKADKTAVADEVTRLEGLISTAKSQADKGVADAATAQAKANAAATQAETNKTNIASLSSTKADKTQVATDIATAKSEVQTYVDNQFKAADAMRYMGETDSLAHLVDGSKLKEGHDPAQAGDTYVLTSNDTVANAGIGDLFIAKVDGDNSQWTHIKSGYNASHENKLVGADNKIKLQSYAGIDLNSIEVEGLGSAEVTVANNKLTVSTVWGSF